MESPSIPSGSHKDAWPELLHKSGEEAINVIKRSVQTDDSRVYLQRPAEPYASPPFNPGRDSDVWVYTDYQNRVYEVPKQGTWHFNRVSPGWPELEGAGWQEAVQRISRDMIGSQILYGPIGFNSGGDQGVVHHITVEIGADGNVVGISKVI